MTFINHGISGGLVHGGVAYLCYNDPIFVTAMATTGFIVGIAPDVASWIDRKFNPNNPDGNWWNYNIIHGGWINNVMRWIPAWGLHTWIDSKIHPYPEHKLAYRLTEAGHWVLYGLLLWWWV